MLLTKPRATTARLLTALLALCLLPAPALADWHLIEDSVPSSLADAAMLVGGYDGEVVISFLGDCTLGGESTLKNTSRGFVKTIEREGMAHPFQNLLSLLTTDDISVVNLEGVLSDRSLRKVPKKFNFLGETAYAQILTLGGVELAGLANNHANDYGTRGYTDTVAALDAAGVMHFGSHGAALWERDGVMIGFTGTVGRIRGSTEETLEAQMQALRAAGCQIIIHVMHAGTEYAASPSSVQRGIARTAIALGADLVVGHHPHVVQGLEWVDGVPVVYSLGNAVFGGNANPRDYDALLLQAVFTFSQSRAQTVQLRFYPIRVSSEDRFNNYQPVLLNGDDAQRVLTKLEESTKTPMPSFLPGEGAATEPVPTGDNREHS